MDDPVIAEDGFTYNRPAIERHFSAHTPEPTLFSLGRRPTTVPSPMAFVSVTDTKDGKTKVAPKQIGLSLKPNHERKAAIERARLLSFDPEKEKLEWDQHGLQHLVPSANGKRSLPLTAPATVEPPRGGAHADMTADLSARARLEHLTAARRHARCVSTPPPHTPPSPPPRRRWSARAPSIETRAHRQDVQAA